MCGLSKISQAIAVLGLWNIPEKSTLLSVSCSVPSPITAASNILWCFLPGPLYRFRLLPWKSVVHGSVASSFSIPSVGILEVKAPVHSIVLSRHLGVWIPNRKTIQNGVGIRELKWWPKELQATEADKAMVKVTPLPAGQLGSPRLLPRYEPQVADTAPALVHAST